jgi:predicted outer membrane repeat protein
VSGGAIYFNQSDSYLNSNNCVFKSNTAV